MSGKEIELGPVDYLIVEWPTGTQPNGKGLGLLADFSESGLIRVLDLVFVQKDQDEKVSALALMDIDGDGDLDLVGFEDASSGLLGQDDYDEAGSALEPGASAAILLYENRWARPFVAAVKESGAQLVASGRIAASDLSDAVEALEPATA